MNYAVSDTASVVAAIEKSSGRFYPQIKEHQLTDKAATLKGVRAQLGALNYVDAADSVVLAFAGHGLYIQDEWYFLPQDVRLTVIPGTAISARELEELLVESPAQHILVIVDACNSGGGIDSFNRYKNFQRRFVQRMGRSAGIAVLTATRRDQDALEAPEIGHGLFTYTILKGIRGKADITPVDGNISAHEIAKFVADSLPSEAAQLESIQGYSQDPTYFVIGADFLLGRADRG